MKRSLESLGLPSRFNPQALLARVLERENLQRALKQVRQNQGAPGIGGMTVDELPESSPARMHYSSPPNTPNNCNRLVKRL